MRSARIKALAIRLAELKPQGPKKRKINGFEELNRHYSAALIHLIESSKLGQKRLYVNPANRLLAAPVDGKWFRQFTEPSPLFGSPDMRECGEDFLRSHAITETAAAALAEGKYERFLELRLETLNQIERDFVSSIEFS